VLVIRIEMWPLGDESRKRELGVAHIINDGTGDLKYGDYKVKLFKSPEYAKTPGVWKSGQVLHFPRERLGPWDLLYRALRSAISDRNKGG
jgi:hypothetical protein